MLTPDLDTVRLFLHVLAATIWVGGQIVLAVLVPVLKRAGADTPGAAARAFNRIAWPAFGVLVVTGIWNIAAIGDREGDYHTTLGIKLAFVVASGVTAFLHTKASSRKAMALFGALTGVTALITLFLGVLLSS